MIGKTLRGRYEIISTLGNGGFGQTFFARDLDLPGHPQCVVKLLKPQSNSPVVLATARRLFEREAQVLYQLGHHELIPQLMAHFEEESEFYLVQELIKGSDLRSEFYPQNRWPVAKVIEFLQEVLSILNFIHQQNVIHRDIKPSNLMRRSADNKLVLIDFGAVKQITTQTLDPHLEESFNTAIGTPGYVAPEQARGQPQPASDLYALGMMAVQALTGISPHQLPEDPVTKEKLWRNLLTENQSKSTILLEIIDKLICYNWFERYQNANQVIQALYRVEICSVSENETTAKETETIAELKTLPSSLPLAKEKPMTASNPQDYRHRQILINKVINFWIKGVLETSLHGRAMIELGLSSRLDLIERPWGIVWGNPESDGDLLPSGIRVSDKFKEMGEGRSLLILGEAGAGKTTTLLQLARDLLQEAKTYNYHPVPVVFNLSSWTNYYQKFASWLIAELKTQYQVSPDIARRWIASGQLLLLLDGLDEVSPKLQDACVAAINQFCQEYGTTELVVCSRISDYKALQKRLKLQSSICLQPLTPLQIQRYLDEAGPELASLKTALQEDNNLQELARSPLMLTIMTLAYRGIATAELLEITDIEARREHLFNTYIQRMFSHRSVKTTYSREQTIYWLSWLAQSLLNQSQTVFFLERMQPSLLYSKWQKLIYVESLAITFFGFAGAFGYLMLPKTQLPLALAFGAFLFWLIFGLDRIQPVETLKWSWQKAFQHLVLGVLGGAVLLFPFKIIYHSFLSFLNFKIITLVIPPTESLARGIVFGLSLGVIYGLIQGCRGAAIQQKTFANQGIIQSAINSLLFASIGFLVLGFSATLLQWKSKVWVAIGLLFGLAAGGGEACIKHLLLRIMLWRSGAIPWNYAQFLDYAVSKIFLQKVGGGYIFIHRLMLEHFAKLYSSHLPSSLNQKPPQSH